MNAESSSRPRDGGSYRREPDGSLTPLNGPETPDGSFSETAEAAVIPSKRNARPLPKE